MQLPVFQRLQFKVPADASLISTPFESAARGLGVGLGSRRIDGGRNDGRVGRHLGIRGNILRRIRRGIGRDRRSCSGRDGRGIGRRRWVRGNWSGGARWIGGVLGIDCGRSPQHEEQHHAQEQHTSAETTADHQSRGVPFFGGSLLLVAGAATNGRIVIIIFGHATTSAGNINFAPTLLARDRPAGAFIWDAILLATDRTFNGNRHDRDPVAEMNP